MPHRYIHGVVFNIVGVAHTVDATHRGHHDDVASARKQCCDRAEAQTVDFLIDLQVFLNVFVRRRDVGFRLIIVVIRHEIVHRVFGEKTLELAVELGSERLVVRQNERRLACALNDVRHGESFTRAGHTKQRLIRHTLHHAIRQFVDGLWLVASWGIFRMKFKIHLSNTF